MWPISECPFEVLFLLYHVDDSSIPIQGGCMGSNDRMYLMEQVILPTAHPEAPRILFHFSLLGDKVLGSTCLMLCSCTNAGKVTLFLFPSQANLKHPPLWHTHTGSRFDVWRSWDGHTKLSCLMECKFFFPLSYTSLNLQGERGSSRNAVPTWQDPTSNQAVQGQCRQTIPFRYHWRTDIHKSTWLLRLAPEDLFWVALPLISGPFLCFVMALEHLPQGSSGFFVFF